MLIWPAALISVLYVPSYCKPGLISALLPNADVRSTVDEVLSHSSESRLDLFGGELVGRVGDRTDPPFSRLLQAACDHVEKTNSVIIFESPALQAIVQ